MKHSEEKVSLDPEIEKCYSKAAERERLLSGMFQVEKERTLRILKRFMPTPPAVVVDVGGAAGAYSFPLASLGYEVHLIDPVPLHIQQAKEENGKPNSPKLASCSIGDARSIEKPDACADVVLFLGPLYHLVTKEDRLRALREAHRILRPGGLLFAAVITRFSSLLDGIYRGFLHDPQYVPLVEKDLKTGQHRNEGTPYFTTAYLHHPNEVSIEVEASGLKPISLIAIEGPVWHDESVENLKKDPVAWEALLRFLEMIESDQSVIGTSCHIMSVSRKEH